MTWQTIKLGSQGSDVSAWQRIVGVLVTGVFDPVTEAATVHWQSAHRLVPDGVVGPKTWGLADQQDAYPRPDFKPLGLQRPQLFGTFEWSDRDGDGWIQIDADWIKRNIVRLEVPQLAGVEGWRGHDQCHRLALSPILKFFAEIEANGLLPLLKTWGGCWAPRRIRRAAGGFSDNLSAHAWGCAFDINVPWNGLGQKPAAKGQPGSVIELLPIAYKYGFYWGGLFGGGSSGQDGMHFELSKAGL